MGIAELLPFLKPVEKARHLSEYRGLTAGVDAYVLLHKGAFACPTLLLTNDAEGVARVVRYCMTRIRQLGDHGITPVVVFDGAPLPAKAATEDLRASRRAASLARAFEFEDAGDKTRAFHAFVGAVEISTFLAKKFQEALERESIRFIVAPYEADAQLALLSLRKSVDFVISEDSDLLTYGCSRVLYKLDAKSGRGVEISLSDVLNKFHVFTGLHDFQVFCVLCGCDYLPTLPRVNPKKAFNFMQRCLGQITVANLVRMAQIHSVAVPADYEANFIKALQTFRHQTVFDPLSNSLQPLTAIQDPISDLAFLGTPYNAELAVQVATGQVCPITKQPFLTPPVCSLNSLRPTVVAGVLVIAVEDSDDSCSSSAVEPRHVSPPKKRVKTSETADENSLERFAFGKPTTREPSKLESLSSYSFINR